MNRNEITRYIADEYGADEEHIWARYPDYAVFRHHKSKKWFALIMDIPRNKIGLDGTERIDVLDVRCDPLLIGSLLQENGFYPAYHMNKSSWITIALDDTVEAEKIEWLLDMSFQTAGKK